MLVCLTLSYYRLHFRTYFDKLSNLKGCNDTYFCVLFEVICLGSNSVYSVLRLHQGLNRRQVFFRFSTEAENFSVFQGSQNSFGTHPDSYSVGTAVLFPGNVAAEV